MILFLKVVRHEAWRVSVCHLNWTCVHVLMSLCPCTPHDVFVLRTHPRNKNFCVGTPASAAPSHSSRARPRR